MEYLTFLETFLAVAENLSFAEAARRLDLTPSATGKSIARLEARLGVRLFQRSTRRVRLTAEGEMLLQCGRRVREELRETEAALSRARSEPQGRLRLSLPAIGYRFLAPHLPAFACAYPKVHLDLDLNDRLVDLVGEGIDAAIRSGVLPDSALTACKLGSFRFLLCAAPSYLAAHGEPSDANALTNHRLVRFRYPGTETLQLWELRTPLPSEAQLGPPFVACNNMEAVLAATIGGLGIAWMPDFLAAEALAQRRLVTLLQHENQAEGVFWLIWVGGRPVSSKLRAFIDFATSTIFRSHAPYVAKAHEATNIPGL